MPNNIIMADKASGEWTTEQIASKQGPSGNITLEGTNYPAYAIYKMPAVTQVHFVNVTAIPDHGVVECSLVEKIIAQKATSIGNVAAAYNPNLKVLDILGGGALNSTLGFAQNPNLQAVIIRSNTAKDVANNAFNGNKKPVVYVPSAAIASYMALNNWSAHVTSGNVTFEELEGSDYEPLDWWVE